MSESFAGMIKQMVQETNKGILTCTVVKTSPLQLRVQGNADTVLFKECLIVPEHVTLAKGNTAYVMQSGDNSYFVLGKGG